MSNRRVWMVISDDEGNPVQALEMAGVGVIELETEPVEVPTSLAEPWRELVAGKRRLTIEAGQLTLFRPGETPGTWRATTPEAIEPGRPAVEDGTKPGVNMT